MSESIILVCAECANDDDFYLFYTPGSNAIVATCKECDTTEVWRNP